MAYINSWRDNKDLSICFKTSHNFKKELSKVDNIQELLKHTLKNELKYRQDYIDKDPNWGNNIYQREYVRKLDENICIVGELINDAIQ